MQFRGSDAGASPAIAAAAAATTGGGGGGVGRRQSLSHIVHGLNTKDFGDIIKVRVVVVVVVVAVAVAVVIIVAAVVAAVVAVVVIDHTACDYCFNFKY